LSTMLSRSWSSRYNRMALQCLYLYLFQNKVVLSQIVTKGAQQKIFNFQERLFHVLTLYIIYKKGKVVFLVVMSSPHCTGLPMFSQHLTRMCVYNNEGRSSAPRTTSSTSESTPLQSS
uniref:Uncharacterized protein n=1 Tax=Scophthalmus maximus TaxID=52904 RepID=A0A8D3D5E8_SCOMX